MDLEKAEQADSFVEAGKFSEALSIYQDLYESGEEEFCHELGETFASMNQFEEAKKWLLKSIDLGNASSSLLLAQLYEDEFCDESLAIHYYELALASGETAAAYALGVHYHLEGHDLQSAERYYYLVAREGDPDGLEGLVQLCECTDFRPAIDYSSLIDVFWGQRQAWNVKRLLIFLARHNKALFTKDQIQEMSMSTIADAWSLIKGIFSRR